MCICAFVCGSVVFVECLPSVHNDYYYPESISPSPSTMLEDSTSLDGETPLAESGMRD